jgi:methionyl-tRNA formyltransferase
MVRRFSLKIAIASTSMLAKPTLDLLGQNGGSISTLFTKGGKPRGRGRDVLENEISVLARESGLAIENAETSADIAEVISRDGIELVIAISYGKLLKKEALVAPTYGWLNLHFSKLPKFRGAAPVQRAILSGENITGITVFKLDEGMDTGPIYLQTDFDLESLNAAQALNEMSVLGASLILETLKMIKQGKAPTPQSGTASLAPKIEKNELRIKWTDESKTINRQIRAFSDAPGAWAEFRGKKLKILQARENTSSGLPGECLNVEPLIIGTGKGSIEVIEVQAESSKRMTSTDWIRGARIDKGDIFH